MVTLLNKVLRLIEQVLEQAGLELVYSPKTVSEESNRS